jgi:hypothetical protein
MQIAVALVVIWVLFALLSWLLHAVKWMLVIAIIASVLTVGVRYIRQNIRQK